MKILQLCKKFPFPLKDGESIAVTYLSKALHELNCKITLLSMNTQKHYMDIDKLPSDYNHYEAIHTVYLDNRIKPLDAFFNLFSKRSYHITRFETPEFENYLIRLLKEEEFDVVQLEGPNLAPYISVIRKYSNALVAMRAHNVEHEIWARVANNYTFLPLKWYLKMLVRKLKYYEIEQLQNYDILVAMTARDLRLFKQLGYNGNSVVTPVGLDSRSYTVDYSSYRKPLSISFIGSLDWIPNIEGLKWFLSNVWDKAVHRFSELSLHIAGRNTPKWIYYLGNKNVFVHGEIPDSAQFINQHSIMIVPLFSGSGMRVKILEGMMLGRVVITTSIGLEGIDCTPGKNILVADTPAEFIERILWCYNNKNKLIDIGTEAHKLISEQYDNQNIGIKLLATYQKQLQQKRLVRI